MARNHKNKVSEYNGFTDSQRNKTRAWLKNQILYGRLARPSKCCVCSQDKGVFYYHVENHNEPFGLQLADYPMCYVCYMMVRCRFKSWRQWLQYNEDLRAGKIFPEFMSANWPRFVALFIEGVPPFRPGPIRPVLAFDTMGPQRQPLSRTRINLVQPEIPPQIQTQLL